VEAAYSLSILAGDRGDAVEAFAFLRRALRLLPAHSSLEPH
jgi:hypothetical protein